jgi:hemerythrin-like domain-containing protein
MTSATTILRKEHDVIVRMLEVSEALARKLTRNEAVAPETLNGILEFFAVFNDTCHHGKEEGLLFPLMEKKGVPRQGGPLGVMLMEHDEGRSLVKEMQKAAADYAAGRPKSGDRWAIAASAYSELLRQHIFKENNVLFAMADRLLSEADQQELSAAFQKEEEKIGAGTHQRLHTLMERLVAELLPKAS